MCNAFKLKAIKHGREEFKRPKLGERCMCMCINRLAITNMTILPKLTSRGSEIPVNIQMDFLYKLKTSF